MNLKGYKISRDEETPTSRQFNYKTSAPNSKEEEKVPDAE